MDKKRDPLGTVSMSVKEVPLDTFCHFNNIKKELSKPSCMHTPNKMNDNITICDQKLA